VCVCVCVDTPLLPQLPGFQAQEGIRETVFPRNDRIEAKETVRVTETVYCETQNEVEETVESRAHDINGTKK